MQDHLGIDSNYKIYQKYFDITVVVPFDHVARLELVGQILIVPSSHCNYTRVNVSLGSKFHITYIDLKYSDDITSLAASGQMVVANFRCLKIITRVLMNYLEVLGSTYDVDLRYSVDITFVAV